MRLIHEDYMRHAIKLAKLAEQAGEVPIGALIVDDGEIIAEAYNAPIQNNDPSAHAEMIAIRRAGDALHNYRLVNTTLYVTLEPCMMCVGAIVHARIQQVVFGAYDLRAGAVESQTRLFEAPFLNHRVAWEGGVLSGECASLLQAFFKQRR